MLTEGSYRASSATRSIRSIRDWTLRKVPPKIEGVDPPALSIFPNHQDSKHLCQDLSWYNWWINDQLETIPHALLDLLPRTKRDLLLESSSPEIKIFHAIADLIKNDTNPSIDGTVEHLSELGLFQNRGDGRAEEGYRTLVFAFLGWQTMLYQPSFGTCPPQQLAILNNLDGYQGQAFLAFKQDQSSAKKRLDTFLMGFGLLFPPKNVCMSEEQEDIQAFETFKTIECQELNASVLNSIAHINIQWVDILAPHLEFNKATNTLYLFRYPSFCIANLPCDGKDGHAKGIIYG
ncbi:MAG: hypothetical protein M1827_005647 [Pycnora praestabilis]|nr:MAG: hypothetical protein M1827_005647 [Pycnora praestabilis]